MTLSKEERFNTEIYSFQLKAPEDLCAYRRLWFLWAYQHFPHTLFNSYPKQRASKRTMSREILCYPSVLIAVQIWTPGWQSSSPELAKILISLVYYAITSLFCGFCRTFTGIYVPGFFGETGTLSWLLSKAWIEPLFFLLSFTPVFLQMLPLRLW